MRNIFFNIENRKKESRQNSGMRKFKLTKCEIEFPHR